MNILTRYDVAFACIYCIPGKAEQSAAEMALESIKQDRAMSHQCPCAFVRSLQKSTTVWIKRNDDVTIYHNVVHSWKISTLWVSRACTSRNLLSQPEDAELMKESEKPKGMGKGEKAASIKPLAAVKAFSKLFAFAFAMLPVYCPARAKARAREECGAHGNSDGC